MNQRYKAEHLHPDRGDVNNLSRFLALHSLDLYLFFLFNDAATPEIYTLSLHDALPICPGSADRHNSPWWRRTATRKWSSENGRSEEHTSELQSPCNIVCRPLLEKKKQKFSIFSQSNTQHHYYTTNSQRSPA